MHDNLLGILERTQCRLTPMHSHLGITKCSIRRDQAEERISKGLKTLYALTGAGIYTVGLLLQHRAAILRVYCVPRMLHGTAVTIFAKGKSIRLSSSIRFRASQKSAADESVCLMTGLIPLGAQVNLEKLLLI